MSALLPSVFYCHTWKTLHHHLNSACIRLPMRLPPTLCLTPVKLRGRAKVLGLPALTRAITMGRRLPLWIALLIMALGPLRADAESSWRYCDPDSQYKVTVQNVTVDPDPVIKGSGATFQIPATTSEPISGGNVEIKVYLLGFFVYGEKDDICSKTSCPIAQGEFKLSNSQGLPRYTPTGSYRLEMEVTDGKGSLLTCVSINFQIVSATLELE